MLRTTRWPAALHGGLRDKPRYGRRDGRRLSCSTRSGSPCRSCRGSSETGQRYIQLDKPLTRQRCWREHMPTESRGSRVECPARANSARPVIPPRRSCTEKVADERVLLVDQSAKIVATYGRTCGATGPPARWRPRDAGAVARHISVGNEHGLRRLDQQRRPLVDDKSVQVVHREVKRHDGGSPSHSIIGKGGGCVASVIRQ
jgi:hypothetical protein